MEPNAYRSPRRPYIDRPTSAIDLTGEVFGRLTASEFVRQIPGKQSVWLCVCECGGVKEVSYGALVQGSTRSCGCLRKGPRVDPELLRSPKNPLYSIWMGIRTRCYNEKHPTYQRYGARGIVMSHEWLADFDRFRVDMGPRPSPDHSIERRDNNGPYSKQNCRWATREEQCGNKTNNRVFDWKGKQRILQEICRMENVRYHNTRQRIVRQGQPLELAIANTKASGKTYIERAACRKSTTH